MTLKMAINEIDVAPSDIEVEEWVAKEADLVDICAASQELRIVSSNRNPSSTTWGVSSTNDSGSKVAFIKHHKEGIMYERERSILVSLRRYSATGEPYTIPEILVWNDKRRLIALRWLQGEPVGRKLRAAVARTGSSQGLQQGLSLAYEVGRWLYHFERRTVTGRYGSFPTEAVMNRIKELNLLIRSTGLHRFNESFSKSIEKYVELNLDLMDDTYKFSAIHRDFWFGHIWKGNKSIVVIDYGRCIDGPRGRDAVQFYLGLTHLSNLNPLVSNRKVRQLQAEFLRGYGELDFSAPHINVYMMLVQLEQLAGIVDKTHKHIIRNGVARLHARACICSLSHLLGYRER